ncbi:MAG: sigma-70 family RNA polymerase sigma factor [Candidatus Aminicenantes bacterium]|nr:sigma-70 family RNA polymerase sigma factor [Candidatus Aminicenantes bacterium]
MLESKPTDIDIEKYYSRYGPMVLRRCRQLLQDEDRALDAMQEVFTKVLTKKERLHGLFPSSLLFRISTNVCLNMIRDQKKHHSLYQDNLLIQIAVLDEKEKNLVIRDTLDRIFKIEKQSTREIAVLHFVDGMTLEEVANEVGLSLSGVRKRIRQLRARIKNQKELRYEN